MKLYTTPRSPYARKVRVVAAHHAIPLEIVDVELRPISPALLAANPLGKVPALVLDDGMLIADSPVIGEYLDAIGTGPTLLPTDPLLRARIRTIEAIADGMQDAAVGVVYEHLLREEGTRSPGILAKHAKTMQRGAEWLAANREVLEGPLHMGSIAAAVTLDYLRHRMPDYGLAQAWEVAHFDLSRWLNDTLKIPAISANTPPEWQIPV